MVVFMEYNLHIINKQKSALHTFHDFSIQSCVIDNMIIIQ